ncbi:MAG: ABC transporter ATP-binding protein [Bacteroidota bacterium]|nr:ABC transporter ATP-binding protein [Bacteroidota bacterium]
MRILLELLPYFRRYRSMIAVGVLSIVFSVAFSVIAPIMVREAVDSLRANVSAGSIARYAGLILAVSAAAGVFLFLQRRTIIVASRRIENDLRNDLMLHLVTLSPQYFQNTPTGEIIAYSTNDIAAVRMFAGPAVMYSIETVLTFVIVLGMLLHLHPMLTLYALIPLPLVSLVVYRLGSVIHKRFEDIQSHYAVLTARAQETLSGIRVVKSYLREAYEIERFESLSKAYLGKNLALARVQALSMPLLSMLIGLSLIITVWYGGLQVIEGRLTLGQLTQFLMYVGMMIWPMIAIGWVISIVQRAVASMERLRRLFSARPEIADDERTDRTITRIRGAIRFEGVSFRYADGLPEVLRGISLDIPPASTVAVIGPTGSGKSTLVHLIPRLYDVTGGVLLVDGTDVRRIPLAVLRRSIACVTQETFLFSDTLEANIAYGAPGAVRADIEWASEIAQLVDDVRDFPQGYDTVIGERGITLSGGQRQRVGIARALLRQPAVLILDDALSAVDTQTEDRILEGLKSVMRERTSILISHRVSTVRNADMIVVLDDGVIAERGTHDSLIAAGGRYAELYRKQRIADELAEME